MGKLRDNMDDIRADVDTLRGDVLENISHSVRNTVTDALAAAIESSLRTLVKDAVADGLKEMLRGHCPSDGS